MVDGASSATMVLLPKQVHLQNDVGATPYQRVSEHGRGETYWLRGIRRGTRGMLGEGRGGMVVSASWVDGDQRQKT